MLRVLLCIFSVILLFGCDKHSNDEDMLQNFQEHRADLEDLVAMFQNDRGLGRVGDGFTRPDDPSIVGVSMERVASYRKLCSAIKAPNCIEGYNDDYFKAIGGGARPGPDKRHIYIHSSAIGLSVSGSSKGYLYSRNPKLPVVESLDDLPRGETGTWIRRVEGNWYLYYSE